VLKAKIDGPNQAGNDAAVCAGAGFDRGRGIQARSKEPELQKQWFAAPTQGVGASRDSRKTHRRRHFPRGLSVPFASGCFPAPVPLHSALLNLPAQNVGMGGGGTGSSVLVCLLPLVPGPSREKCSKEPDQFPTKRAFVEGGGGGPLRIGPPPTVAGWPRKFIFKKSHSVLALGEETKLILWRPLGLGGADCFSGGAFSRLLGTVCLGRVGAIRWPKGLGEPTRLPAFRGQFKCPLKKAGRVSGRKIPTSGAGRPVMQKQRSRAPQTGFVDGVEK